MLVASSNSMEVGVLGTTESGETPTWKQYITLDEARIELPLTSEKQETYPVGFAFETGSTHQLVIAEKPFPVMPMIHILSTHGQLVSFNFLNFSQNAPGLCSPPRPISNNAALSQFRPINTTAGAATQPAPTSDVASQQPQPVTSEVSFALPSGATSTPAQVVDLYAFQLIDSINKFFHRTGNPNQHSVMLELLVIYLEICQIRELLFSSEMHKQQNLVEELELHSVGNDQQ